MDFAESNDLGYALQQLGFVSPWRWTCNEISRVPRFQTKSEGDLVGNLYSYFIYLLFTLLSTDNNHDQKK